MREFQDKRKWRKYIFSNTTIYILAILIIFVLYGIWSAFNIKEKATSRESASLNTLEDLLLRKDVLENKISNLSTSRGLEEEIRDKFRVAREGEKMLIILNESNADEEPKERENIWHRFLNFF